MGVAVLRRPSFLAPLGGSRLREAQTEGGRRRVSDAKGGAERTI